MTLIGASEIGAMLGISPYKTRLALWAEKTQGIDTTDAKPALGFGLEVEDVLLNRFEDMYSLTLVRQQTYTNDRLGMRATPDGVCHMGVVEAKTSIRRDEWQDGVPIWYQAQAQAQMLLTGLSDACIVAYFQDRDYGQWWMKADKSAQEMIVREVEQFLWLVNHQEMPPPVAEDVGLLSDIWPQSLPIETNLSESAAAAVQRIKEIKAARKVEDITLAELEAEVKSELAESDTGVFDGRVLVTWKTSTSRILDQKRFKADYPDLAAEYTIENSSRRFLIK